jgi:hypothetical protein
MTRRVLTFSGFVLALGLILFLAASCECDHAGGDDDDASPADDDVSPNDDDTAPDDDDNDDNNDDFSPADDDDDDNDDNDNDDNDDNDNDDNDDNDDDDNNDNDNDDNDNDDNDDVSPVCSADGWCWQNPLPQGNPLHSIWGASAADVFAVGEAGTILRYDGASWSAMPSGTAARLMGV